MEDIILNIEHFFNKHEVLSAFSVSCFIILILLILIALGPITAFLLIMLFFVVALWFPIAAIIITIKTIAKRS